jgi:hypothetical protein
LAPFDLFGVSPKFYIDGGKTTMTWIGCFCSVVLVSLILFLFVLQMVSHIKNQESIVNSYETQLQGFELLDIGSLV